MVSRELNPPFQHCIQLVVQPTVSLSPGLIVSTLSSAAAPQATVDRFPHIAYDRRKITDAMLTELDYGNPQRMLLASGLHSSKSASNLRADRGRKCHRSDGG